MHWKIIVYRTKIYSDLFLVLFLWFFIPAWLIVFFILIICIRWYMNRFILADEYIKITDLFSKNITLKIDDIIKIDHINNIIKIYRSDNKQIYFSFMNKNKAKIVYWILAQKISK